MIGGMIGGMEIRGRELYDELRRVCDVSVLSRCALTMPDGSHHPLMVPEWNFLERRPNRIIWARDALGWTFRNVAFSVGERKRLRRLLSQLELDMIYLNKFGGLHPAILEDLTSCCVPSITWFGDRFGGRLQSHTNGSWGPRLILGVKSPTPALDRTTLVFNCRFLQRFYAPLFGGYPQQYVIYDGVDTELFHPAPVYSPSPRFVFLGRATREKGFIEFCRAMSVLPRELIDSIEVVARPGAATKWLSNDR